MKSSDVRRKFIEFYKARGHVEIPSAPLVPENDPTTLFISAGMQPLIQNILGEPHPLGNRLVNSQKCFRALDIDEVGDNRHSTFYEMLGNWSFGDPSAKDGIGAGYFKKEQLPWIFEFLTRDLGLDPQKLYVSVFEGDSSVPKDTESIEIWKEIFAEVGIDASVADHASFMDARIYTYPANKNWWSRSGEPEKMPSGEPGGPDSEVFYDFGEELKIHQKSPFKNKKCHPNCDCGRFLEICNSVFMQYQKQTDGSLKELTQKNVDFGGGLERLAAVSENTPDIFMTDLYSSIIRIIEGITKTKYGEDLVKTRAMRIVADHIKGAVMMTADGVLPSNKLQGYILRRLVRRSLLYGRSLGVDGDTKFVGQLVEPIAVIYRETYPDVWSKTSQIKSVLEEEAQRFGKSLEKGLREIKKVEKLDGEIAFRLYETFGFPLELTEEIAKERGQAVEKGGFEKAFTAHQEKSRTAAKGMFKGGLADQSQDVIKLHTATHLLHQSLRAILGNEIKQKGSNITSERLRFDFSCSHKMTQEEIKNVEDLVNQKIKENLPVTFYNMSYEEAIKKGALAFFGERYPEKVKVYSIGNFSREICGGPHVSFTGEVGHFTIVKEESAGAGIRRLYASVSPYEATITHPKHPQP